MQFKLYGKEFEITDSILAAGRFLVKNVIPLAESATKKIGNTYTDYGNLENAANQLFTFKEKIYAISAKSYVELLHEQELRDYDYQVEDFMNDYYSAFGGAYIDELCEMIERYYKILANDKNSAEYQRELRKATRGRFYGTNLSSSAVAGSLNLFSGAVHSIFNAVDGAITNSKIDDKMDAVYKECEDAVWYCVFGDIYNMGVLYFSIAKFDNFYIENENRARKIKKAIDEGQVPQNKLSEKVAQVLFLMPQYEENYIWAFKLLGDDYFKLIDYAELFEQKAAVKEINSAKAELEVQKKKKQQELKLKAEKVTAAQKRQDELKHASKELFGDNSDYYDKTYSGNIFYPILLDAPNKNFFDFSIQVCNAAKKFLDRSSKYIWGRDNFYFEGKFNDELKEMFDKFKYPPPNFSDLLVMISCNEYFNTILMTNKKIISVTFSEPPIEILYSDIKNFRYVRKEGVMTYNDYIEIDGKTFSEVEFDEKIFNLVKQIVEIFKLKNYCLLRKASITEFKANLRDNYKFNSYVYYNYANDEKAQKKFKAAIESYAEISDDEVPILLFDATVFGSAKEGFMLTNKGFHSHGIGIDQNFIYLRFIPYENLGVAQDTKKGNKIIKINAIEMDTVAMKDEDIEKLVKVIRECRDYFTAQPPKNPAPPKVETDKNLSVETETSSTWEEWAGEKNNTPEKVPAKFDSTIIKNATDDVKNFVKQLQKKYSFRYYVCFNDFSGKSALHDKSFIGYINNNLSVSQNDKCVVLNSVIELDTRAFTTDEKIAMVNLVQDCKKFFTDSAEQTSTPKVKETVENLSSKIEKPQIENIESPKIETVAETKSQEEIVSELRKYLNENYKFSSYVYYNYSDDKKAQKKFRAALGSYAKISDDEIPIVI